MSFYSGLAQTAQRLLASYGVRVTATRRTVGAYDPATGAATTTTTEQSLTVAVFDYDTRHIDGTMILRGDKQAFIGSVGVSAPKPGDTFPLGDQTYTIVSVKPLAPALVAVLYAAQIRSA